MIHKLVRSAFQTGCLSVESEGLLRQMLTIKGCKPSDLAALEELYRAVHTGQIRRESCSQIDLMPISGCGSR
jgi:hypothetical protein